MQTPFPLESGRHFFSIEYRSVRAIGGEYPEHYIREIKGSVIAEQEPAEDAGLIEGPKYPVGTFEAYLLLLEEADEEMEFSALEVMDSHPDVRGYYSELFEREYSSEAKEAVIEQFDLDFYINRILVLHTIEIIPSYRGKNLGLAVATELIWEYGRGSELILTIPCPRQSSQESNIAADPENEKAGEQELLQAKKKLSLYWSKLGFQAVGTSGIMAMNYDQFSPYHFKAR